jgi:SulP family sulfate permease
LTVILAATIAARVSARAPAPLIGVALAILLARVLGLHEKEVGPLPASLPPFVGFSWSPRDVFTVLPSAFVLAFVSSVNILITSRVVEHFRGRHQRMKTSDADAELGAYGIANVVAGMFAAPPSVGIPARSLAVVRCGGSTRLSNLLHAAFLVGILWFGAGLVSRIPLPALAGVTAWMGLCLLDWSAWRRLPKMSRVDAAAFLATAGAVLAINPILAVGVGCSLYGLEYLYNRSIRPTSRVPDLQVP